jgi:hypothetical protein
VGRGGQGGQGDRCTSCFSKEVNKHIFMSINLYSPPTKKCTRLWILCMYVFIYLASLSYNVITRPYVQFQGNTQGMWLASTNAAFVFQFGDSSGTCRA